jgi:hypothetical protein
MDCLRRQDNYFNGKVRRLGREAPLIRVRCTKALKSTLDAAYRRAAVILTTKTGRSYSKRYLAQLWEKTCKAAGIVDLHFHDIRGRNLLHEISEKRDATSWPCGLEWEIESWVAGGDARPKAVWRP